MKIQPVLVALCLVIAGSLIGVFISPRASAQSRTQGGPYQIVLQPMKEGNNMTIVMCNTATGHCWVRGIDDNGTWQKIASPFEN
jgi:hypothetical protein